MTTIQKFNISKSELNSRYFINYNEYDYRWLFCSRHTISLIVKKYTEEQRFYHNTKHLNELILLISFLEDSKAINKHQATQLFLISVFHDAIYDPRKFDNEEKSAELFLDTVIEEIVFTKKLYFSPDSNTEEKIKYIKNNHEKATDILEIYDAIIDTKTHKPRSPISEIFSAIDLFGLSNYTSQELIETEENVFKEYQCYDYLLYHENRLKILTEFNETIQSEELERLINYVRFRKIKIALYPGSFNPIHIGHVDIIEKAEKVFDKVIICRGVNPNKTDQTLPDIFEFAPYREVKKMYGYQVDFLEQLNNAAREYEKKNNLPQIVDYTFIRGIRNHTDFDFEFNQLQYNKNFAKEKNLNFNVVYFFSESHLSHISSSDIRAMMNDYTGNKLSKKFLPKE